MLSTNQVEKYSELSQNFEYVKEEFHNLKNLLEKFKTSRGDSVKVFLQGSYKNKTSINSSSDIDIVVYLDSLFNSNLNSANCLIEDGKILRCNNKLGSAELDRHRNCFKSADYSYEDFKSELKEYILKNGTNNYRVEEGRKTIKCIMKRGNQFSFDIVPAIEYRFYSSFRSEQEPYQPGNFLRSSNGKRIINFPKQSFENSTRKNKETSLNWNDLQGGTYKETVRILKNILVHHLKESNQISSFALESILYNVNSQIYRETNKNVRCKKVIREALSIVNSQWDSLIEPNELLWVRGINGIDKQKVFSALKEIADYL